MEEESQQRNSKSYRGEYESLSEEEDEMSSINPFATNSSSAVKRKSQPLVETVGEHDDEGTAVATPTATRPTPHLSDTFDPMSPTTNAYSKKQQKQQTRPQNSLLDEEPNMPRMTSNVSTPGVAGFLEMEDEPTRVGDSTSHTKSNASGNYYGTNTNMNTIDQPSPFRPYTPDTQRMLEEQEDLIDFEEDPIQTSSGLLLTHRKTSAETRAGKQRTWTSNHHEFPPNYRPSKTRFEVETIGPSWGSFRGGGGRTPNSILQARRLLSFAKAWVVFFCVILVLGTAGMLHSFRHERSGDWDTQQFKSDEDQQQLEEAIPSQIYLLPLSNAAELAHQQREAEQEQASHNRHNKRGVRKLLSDMNDLRHEFDDWVLEHKKNYSSIHEKERRFHIWKNSRRRAEEKNKRNGYRKLMNRPVFGMNHLSDLTPEEFQTQFLAGYNGPNADGHEIKTGRRRKLSNDPKHAPPVMHPDLKVSRHPEVHRRILQQWSLSGYTGGFTTSSRCDWYDISCWLRIVFNEYLYVGIGTMEPKYDAETYPKAMDWRDLGAVSSVRRQGDCGACWGITAVETIESAYFIATGNLVDLSETEVISCTESCNMCYGGWPQDAYDYAMEHAGIMTSNEWSYSGSDLLSLSEEMLAGEDELDEELFASYRSQNCPASQEGSGDNGGSGRYGNIKGYGFATDRCVCYSDGSGCNCDNQNEGLAIRNIASYGPATVCLDASTWQDYTGGIITSASGCSAKFLAMNHCVQVVGYAYNDGSNNEGEDDREGGSGSNSKDEGSQDGSDREGYWIVRNQWGSYWGMNGYAYVAMGENTCGILNDMTQAYL